MAVEKDVRWDSKNKANVNGGAIALGIRWRDGERRLVRDVAYEMKRRKKEVWMSDGVYRRWHGIEVIVESLSKLRTISNG